MQIEAGQGFPKRHSLHWLTTIFYFIFTFLSVTAFSQSYSEDKTEIYTANNQVEETLNTANNILCIISKIKAEQFIDKGPNRPYFNLKLRMEAIAALSCVDYVTFSETDSSVDVIEKIKPNIYIKGQDYKIMKDDVY